VLVCPAGSGRTALLMTLTGRMKPVSGELTVFGRRRAQDIFGHAALAGIDELDGVSESVTVRDLITEQMRWDSSWFRLVRRADDADLQAGDVPYSGDYYGSAGFVELIAKTSPALELAPSSEMQFLADGDKVVLHYRLTFIAGVSGERVEMSMAEVFTVRDGLIVELDVFDKNPSAVAALLAGITR
jgi:ketosteroid isomerase-like protein